MNRNEDSIADILNPKENQVIEGKLIRKIRNQGSKSEHIGYVILTTDQKEIIIEMENDNPFEHGSLVPYEGHDVRANGYMYRGKLIAENINLIQK